MSSLAFQIFFISCLYVTTWGYRSFLKFDHFEYLIQIISVCTKVLTISDMALTLAKKSKYSRVSFIAGGLYTLFIRICMLILFFSQIISCTPVMKIIYGVHQPRYLSDANVTGGQAFKITRFIAFSRALSHPIMQIQLL